MQGLGKGSKNFRMISQIQHDTVSPATKLLEKRRMLYEVQEAFEQQKEEYTRQEENYKKQEEMIRDSDLKIQEDLVRFWKYLVENKNKFDRATERLKDEKRERDKWEAEIENVNNQMKTLNRHSELFEKKISQLQKYEAYLNKVAANTQESELKEILMRYDKLIETNKGLEKKKNKLEKTKRKLKEDIDQFEKETSSKLLDLGNENREKQSKAEALELANNELQNEFEISIKITSGKLLDLGKMLMGIDNIYESCGSSGIVIRAEEKEEDEQKSKGMPVLRGTLRKKDMDQKNANSSGQASGASAKGGVPQIEETYKMKCSKALEKLSSIKLHMEYFKMILEYCNVKKPTKS